MGKIREELNAVARSSRPSVAACRNTPSLANSASAWPTVHYWVERAHGQRLDRVDWSDRSHARTDAAPHRPRDRGPDPETCGGNWPSERPGASGAEAIHQALLERGLTGAALGPDHRPHPRPPRGPGRHGAGSAGRPRRRGWYLPDVAAAGRPSWTASTSSRAWSSRTAPRSRSSTASRCTAAWSAPGRRGAPVTARPGRRGVDRALACASACPATPSSTTTRSSTGTHRHPDAIGRVMRLCLSLGVVPVFVPPRETGFQAMIEGYNGRWQAKVWARFTFTTRWPKSGSSRTASWPPCVVRRAERIEAAPAAPPLPGAMAVGPAGPPPRSDHLRAADGRRRGGATAGAELRGRSAVAQPPGPRRVRPRRGPDPVLRPAAERTRRPSPCCGSSIIIFRRGDSTSDRDLVSLATRCTFN